MFSENRFRQKRFTALAIDEIEKWVLDQFGAYIPSKWTVPTASPADIQRAKRAIDLRAPEELADSRIMSLTNFCDTSSRDVANGCKDFTDETYAPMEATICDEDAADCQEIANILYHQSIFFFRVVRYLFFFPLASLASAAFLSRIHSALAFTSSRQGPSFHETRIHST